VKYYLKTETYNQTEINEKLDTTKKGIQTFFGDAEERFFQNAGREISEKNGFGFPKIQAKFNASNQLGSQADWNKRSTWSRKNDLDAPIHQRKPPLGWIEFVCEFG
jgi:hypothetical protein